MPLTIRLTPPLLLFLLLLSHACPALLLTPFVEPAPSLLLSQLAQPALSTPLSLEPVLVMPASTGLAVNAFLAAQAVWAAHPLHPAPAALPAPMAREPPLEGVKPQAVSVWMDSMRPTLPCVLPAAQSARPAPPPPPPALPAGSSMEWP